MDKFVKRVTTPPVNPTPAKRRTLATVKQATSLLVADVRNTRPEYSMLILLRCFVSRGVSRDS